jgi:hypothetical protein
MLTLEQIQHETKKMGVSITPRSFWRYIELGLLPQGEKYPGQGNVFFFPDYVPERIFRIQTLKRDLGIHLRHIQNSLLYLVEDEPWDKTVVRTKPTGVDLLVWWAALLARLRLFRKPRSEQDDLNALYTEAMQMFSSFGVAQEFQAKQSTDSGVDKEKK